MPDLHCNDHPDWAGDGKTIHVNCSYQLIVDNLMDLTHEQFVHGVEHRSRLVVASPTSRSPTTTGRSP